MAQIVEMNRLLTLPNDPVKYGPWAGTILSGNETSNSLFSIDTNGVVITWPSPVPVESLNLIAANQDLSYADAGTLGQTNGRIWKVPRTAFTNYVGDVLVTDEGNVDGQPRHVILHWNGQEFAPVELINTNAIAPEQAVFSATSFPSQ